MSYAISVRKRVTHPIADKRTGEILPGVTKQEFKKESDINEIVARFKKTGVLDHVNSIKGTYGDFSQATDYQTAMNKVTAAQQEFEQLPAKLRARFKNDPKELLKFIEDPKNKVEAAVMGLLSPEATKEVATTLRKKQTQQQTDKEELEKYRKEAADKTTAKT